MAKGTDSLGDQLRELAKRVDAELKGVQALSAESALLDTAIDVLGTFVNVCRSTVDYADGSPMSKAIIQAGAIRNAREEMRRKYG